MTNGEEHRRKKHRKRKKSELDRVREVLKNSKFQRYAGILLVVVVVAVVLALCLPALKNTFETGATELADFDIKKKMIGIVETLPESPVQNISSFYDY